MKTMNIRIRRAYNNFIEIRGSFSWRHEKNVLKSLRTWHKLYVVVGRSDAVRMVLTLSLVYFGGDGIPFGSNNTILDLNN